MTSSCLFIRAQGLDCCTHEFVAQHRRPPSLPVHAYIRRLGVTRPSSIMPGRLLGDDTGARLHTINVTGINQPRSLIAGLSRLSPPATASCA